MRNFWILIGLVWCVFSVTAQDSFAAVVETTFSGVEIKLQNTNDWITLPDGSNTPLGAGDSIRTDSSGRAIVTFLENSILLLLPETTYTLIEFSETDDELTLHAEIEGIAIQHVTGIANFQLDMATYHVTSADGVFAVWSDSEVPEYDTVIVADGQVTVDEVVIEAGSGMIAREEATVVFMEQPYNQARLIGTLDGCAGTVTTRDDTRGVLVRTGSGTGYQRRGLIEDSGQLPLLGQTETSGWTRIQFLNGFGWVVSSAVTTDCDLPILPDNSPEESIVRATNADDRELEMLFPFYGNRLLDSWFYEINQESD